MIDIDREESKTTIDSAVILDTTTNEINLEILIDKDYEGPLKSSVNAALQAKWSNILGPGYEIIVNIIFFFLCNNIFYLFIYHILKKKNSSLNKFLLLKDILFNDRFFL